jgi:hypothetical protein
MNPNPDIDMTNDNDNVELPPSPVDVDPAGDIMLYAGPDLYRMRLPSHFLILASEPFRAMLGPGFEEGDAWSYQ